MEADSHRKPKIILLLIAVTLFIVNTIIEIAVITRKDSLTSTITQAAISKSWGIKILSPKNQALIENNILTVQGVAAPNATIVLYTDNDQASVDSDTAGNFQSNINLVPGINTLTITAINEKGVEKSVTLEVINDT